MTKAQETILRIVDKRRHLTAEDVCEELKKEMANVSISTVYRNLNQFSEKNIIRRVSRGNKPDFFDSNVEAHGHIVCVHCGKVSDVCLVGLEKIINEQAKGKVLGVELLASCICSECG